MKPTLENRIKNPGLLTYTQAEFGSGRFKSLDDFESFLRQMDKFVKIKKNNPFLSLAVREVEKTRKKITKESNLYEMYLLALQLGLVEVDTSPSYEITQILSVAINQVDRTGKEISKGSKLYKLFLLALRLNLIQAKENYAYVVTQKGKDFLAAKPIR